MASRNNNDTTMLFTVELWGLRARYRLQEDGTWRNCFAAPDSAETDFVASEAAEARAHMVLVEETIVLGGTRYDVEPRVLPSESESLAYGSLVFRRDYPAPPERSQLVATIASGDDTVNGSLVLTVDGEFELRQDLSCGCDPLVVVRHESFGAGGHNVGSAASKDDEFIDRTFLASMDYWLEHLRTRMTWAYADYYGGSLGYAEVEAALGEIEAGWSPGY